MHAFTVRIVALFLAMVPFICAMALPPPTGFARGRKTVAAVHHVGPDPALVQVR